MMNKALVLSICLIALVFGGLASMYANRSEATVGISSNIRFDACATGYTRRAPNFCEVTGDPVTGANLIMDNTCRAFSPMGLPPNVTLVQLVLDLHVRSNNAIAQRSANASFHSSDTCTADQVSSHYLSVREFAAVAAGTDIVTGNRELIAPITSTGVVRYISGGSAGSAHFAGVTVLGYWDR